MNRIQEIGRQIAELQTELEMIREQCSHPTVCLKKVHKSNTGNYDPHEDCYWTEFTCGLCGKYWTEEGSK